MADKKKLICYFDCMDTVKRVVNRVRRRLLTNICPSDIIIYHNHLESTIKLQTPRTECWFVTYKFNCTGYTYDEVYTDNINYDIFENIIDWICTAEECSGVLEESSEKNVIDKMLKATRKVHSKNDFSNTEIALRLTEIWGNSHKNSVCTVDETWKAFNKFLKNLEEE